MTLVETLHRTVHFAFTNSTLYQNLYGHCPSVRSLAGFKQLPKLTRKAVLENSRSITDCLAAARLWEKDGILDALSPLTNNQSEFPFTAVENTSDFERRYARVQGILRYAGVRNNERLLILCDSANAYFASDLEDVLTKWEVTILIRDGLADEKLRTHIATLEPRSLILITRLPFSQGLVAPSCRTVVTFMRRHRFSGAKRYETVDVYTKSVFPWMAVRRDRDRLYRSNEVYLNHRCEGPQLFLERDRKHRLLVTALVQGDGSPLLPLIRFETNDRVVSVVGSRFMLLK